MNRKKIDRKKFRREFFAKYKKLKKCDEDWLNDLCDYLIRKIERMLKENSND